MKLEIFLQCMLFMIKFIRILANSKCLLESATYNEQIVNDLIKASSYLTEMLNNTLDLSKLEEGKIIFNMNYQPLDGCYDMIISAVQQNANKKGIKLDCICGKNIPELIKIDKARIMQVVMNLVSNAVRFTPQAGIITLETNWKYNCDMGGNCENCVGNYANKALHNQNSSSPLYIELNSINKEISVFSEFNYI